MTQHTDFYQNPSTFAEVTHKSILVFFMPRSAVAAAAAAATITTTDTTTTATDTTTTTTTTAITTFKFLFHQPIFKVTPKHWVGFPERKLLGLVAAKPTVSKR